MQLSRKTLLVLVLVAIAAGIWYLENRKAGSGSGDLGDTEISVTHMTSEEKEKAYEVAHEISTPDAFINVEEVSVMDEINKGNIVLVDFWTYSCINCQRTLPYLNAWHEKYADQGLTIIGVHTPEFEFEKELANVQRAVDEFEVEYPVVLDNDYSTWRSYENRYWPRKYLVDIDGFVVYDHIGEGAYEQTEEKIVELLQERADRLGEDMEIETGATPENVDEVDFSQPRTPEIYFGYDRLEVISGLPSASCFDTDCEFAFPESVPLNNFALSGTWHIGPEEATLKSNSGEISLNFIANKVNIVAEGSDGPVDVTVILDGENIGSVIVDEAGLYNVVDLGGEYGEHMLELRAEGDGLSVFTFTFG